MSPWVATTDSQNVPLAVGELFENGEGSEHADGLWKQVSMAAGVNAVTRRRGGTPPNTMEQDAFMLHNRLEMPLEMARALIEAASRLNPICIEADVVFSGTEFNGPRSYTNFRYGRVES